MNWLFTALNTRGPADWMQFRVRQAVVGEGEKMTPLDCAENAAFTGVNTVKGRLPSSVSRPQPGSRDPSRIEYLYARYGVLDAASEPELCCRDSNEPISRCLWHPT